MDNFPINDLYELAGTLVNLTAEQKRILNDTLRAEYGLQMELKEFAYNNIGEYMRENCPHFTDWASASIPKQIEL